MDIKTAAQIIRDTLSMDQVLDIYGYKAKHGFMVCPFHGDKDASLRVYKGTNGWHCFGCGKGGSVIDFVMEQEGCKFQVAVTAIDHAFHMGLLDPLEDLTHARKRQELQKFLDEYVDAIYAYMDACKQKIEIQLQQRLKRCKELEEKRRTDPEAMTAGEYDELLIWKDESEYDEDKIEQIELLREEVASWRRMARRTG